jgi:hypothetical protein
MYVNEIHPADHAQLVITNEDPATPTITRRLPRR